MLKFNNILIVGGSYRNIGKTTFVCELIKKFSTDYDIVGVKIKTITDGSTRFHGSTSKIPETYGIKLDQSGEAGKDSCRMMQAGASNVYRISTKSEFIQDAMLDLLENHANNTLVIVESNSLRKVLVPAAYIMIHGADKAMYKPSFRETLELADVRIHSNNEKFDIQPGELDLKVANGNWVMNFVGRE